jgi:hypothetical protein
MQTTDTQEVTQVIEAPKELILSALRGTGSAPVQPAAAPAAEPATPVAEEKPVETTPAQPPAPAAVDAAVAEVAATVTTDTATSDPYASVAEGLSAPAAVPTWTDEAKAVFSKEFGTDDPSALKTQLEQLSLIKGEYEKVKPTLDQFNSLPATILEPLRLALQGKFDEAKNYLASTPSSVLAALEPEKMDDKTLIGTHFPGKISNEQWDMINDPEADPDVVDALKTRIGILREAAADKQRQAVTSAQQAEQSRKDAERVAYENFERGVAATLSNVKSSPLKGLVDQGTVEQFRTGQFIRDFVQEDGVTPTPNAATLLMWARHGQKISEAAEARGYARGKTEAALEATSRQPARPNVGTRSSGDTPVATTQEDQIRSLMFSALTRN